jgi:hypothetical protein
MGLVVGGVEDREVAELLLGSNRMWVFISVLY